MRKTIYNNKVELARMWVALFMALLTMSVVPMPASAQERKPQNKPYIDLRPMHFGILVGLNMQDIEFQNIGPQLVDQEDGTQTTETIVTDQDNWNPGFSVGVLADIRLGAHLSARFSPAMHFGSKHLTFRHLEDLDEYGYPRISTQDMKNTYISFPVSLKFAAERFNNYRPYIMGGINELINLSGKDQDFIQLKRTDTMIEIGLGCDFYLPFFKLIPELKFCYSLTNCLNSKHVDELTDVNKRIFANSVSDAQSKMIVLTFYFE